MPSAAMRVAFFWALARPFLRSQTMAASMSPWASVRAFLQSIMPAPVFSRSSLTWFALIAIGWFLLHRKIAANCVHVVPAINGYCFLYYGRFVGSFHNVRAFANAARRAVGAGCGFLFGAFFAFFHFCRARLFGHLLA